MYKRKFDKWYERYGSNRYIQLDAKVFAYRAYKRGIKDSNTYEKDNRIAELEKLILEALNPHNEDIKKYWFEDWIDEAEKLGLVWEG